jgi:ribosomal protein S18 acetylase RimI-like enzyme
MNDWELINTNLRQALRFFGQATGKGEVREFGSALAIYSGIEYGVFNIGLLLEGERNVAAGIMACDEYFRPRARRWSMWVCEDSLDWVSMRDLRAALGKLNMAEISRSPGMIATDFTMPRRELPAIQSVPVDSQPLRDSFSGLASVCFDIPVGVAREVYRQEQAWPRDRPDAYRGFVGMVAGRPVGIVALVRTGGTLGVYSLGIAPESRKLGYGEALLRATVEHERARGGVERVILQSSDSGHSLYRHMGFRETAQFAVYLKK